MTEHPEPKQPGTTATTRPEAVVPAEATPIPRAVVVSAVVFALGLGVLIGSKIRRPPEVREVPGPERPVMVPVPCQECEHTRAAVAAVAGSIPADDGTRATP